MHEDNARSGAGRFRSLARQFGAHLGHLNRDTAGAAAVIASLLFPIVVGGIGLGAETGYHYMLQRKLQHAADVAAHAAGTRLRAGDEGDQIEAAAAHVARAAGLPSGFTTEVRFPPDVREEFAGLSNVVEVVLTHSQTRFFSSIFVDTPVSMGASAVSQIEATGSVACVLALSSSATRAVTVSGSTNIALSGCDVASNSGASDAFYMDGGTLSAGCVSTVGQAQAPEPGLGQLTLSRCDALREFAPVVRDPYAEVGEPVPPAVSCENNGNVKDTTLVPSYDSKNGVKVMRFCSGLSLKGAVHLEPGLYIIESGELKINGGSEDASGGATVTGEGVTFYLGKTASLKINGNPELNLSAPTDGPFSGLLFFGSRDSSVAAYDLRGSPGSTFQGAIYTPKSQVTFSGNSKVNENGGCTQIVADRVTFTGNSSLGSSCGTSGTSDIETNETVRIIG